MARWIHPKAIGGRVVLACGAALAGCGGLAADGTRDLGPEPSAHRLDQTLAALLEDARALPAGDQRFARYLLLTSWSSDPELSVDDVSRDDVSRDDEAAYAERALWRSRVGASKLANSLSTEPVINVPRAIDDDELLLRIDLRDYAWDRPVTVGRTAYADGWEAIVAGARLAPALEGPHVDRLEAVTGSSRPFLFANDFIATASEGELYYGLLGVPGRLDELQARLTRGSFGESDGEPAQQYRAGFETSGVSTVPRAVERRASASAPSLGYWQAFDFEDVGRGEAIFSEPLGFVPDGTEVLFNLPNGLFGYFMADRAGARVAVSSVRAVSNPAVPDWVLRSANACFSCHNAGVVAFGDQVRDRVMAEPSGATAAARDAILGVYPEQVVMDRFMEEANRRLERSLVQAGQEAGAPDPVSRVYIDELYRPQRRDVAAAQLFVDPADLPNNLSDDALEPDAYREAYDTSLCLLTRQAQNRPSDCF